MQRDVVNARVSTWCTLTRFGVRCDFSWIVAMVMVLVLWILFIFTGDMLCMMEGWRHRFDIPLCTIQVISIRE